MGESKFLSVAKKNYGMRHHFPQHDVTFHVFTYGGILGFYTIQCNQSALTFQGSVLPPSAVILGHHDMLPKNMLRSPKRNRILPILTTFRTPCTTQIWRHECAPHTVGQCSSDNPISGQRQCYDSP